MIHIHTIKMFVAGLALLALCLPASAACGSSASPQQRIDLGGTWDFVPATGPVNAADGVPQIKEWGTIRVPDNWFRQGHDISGQAWYRKRFDLRAADVGRQLRLYFEGVDYAADVWLNGRHVGRHVGYFQPFDFDVSQQARAGSNELVVLVDSPRERPQDWSLHKRLIKGVLSHHDTRPGGAWSTRGQEMNTGGIWAPVHLEISDGLALRRLEVVPQKRDGNNWNVHLTAALASRLPAGSEVQAEFEIAPENFSGKPYRFIAHKVVAGGETQLVIDQSVANPQLWWPVGHGEPNLYRMRVLLRHDGRALAARETVFGFREIAVKDEAGLQWLVNGRRLFIRGTNYISTQWLAEMTPADYLRDIELMQQANVNAVRVHAHVEARAFYDICDRKGMLVMQDFPLQWGYADDDAFIADARRQAAGMVRALNNHPSIASWTMHNEPPWDSPWMKDKYPGYRPEQNRQLDELLYRDVAGLDPRRVVRKLSATQEHVWLGWYFGEWQHYGGATSVPWITEYGAQALPDLPSLKRIFDAATLWPDSERDWETWAFHNFQRHETFDIAKVPMGRNIDEFVRNSQAHQARVIQLAAESYRRQRYAPVAAIFQFLFNENWSSINWGVVDYCRVPKQGHDALRLAYQPVLPSIEWQKDVYAPGETAALGLWLINDTWENLGELRYDVVVHRDGREIRRESLPAEVTADGGVKLRELRLEHLQAGQHVVVAEVARRDGSILGSNRYSFVVR